MHSHVSVAHLTIDVTKATCKTIDAQNSRRRVSSSHSEPLATEQLVVESRALDVACADRAMSRVVSLELGTRLKARLLQRGYLGAGERTVCVRLDARRCVSRLRVAVRGMYLPPVPPGSSAGVDCEGVDV